ncbi:MAG: tRNA pseudouridine(55) synthase TruB, partial [Alphaproteobacteria bacterium]
MGRRRRPPPGARPLHGWVVIDKPRGITSAAVVTRVLKGLRATRAGHGGTLDPLATGVLPIALGEATKTVAYVMNGHKSYNFVLAWGEARSTGDAEGEVTETSDIRPERKHIEAVLGEFTGKVLQVPPAFSAIKVDGQRAYKLARAERDFTLEAREVEIHRIELKDLPDHNHAAFEVSCGKGVYIRSLARDIAVRLGTVGHVHSMRRTRVGPFAEDVAISLDNMEFLG